MQNQQAAQESLLTIAQIPWTEAFMFVIILFLLVLQRHFALPGSAASVLGTLQRGLITFATH
jgi:hypothetical protein